MKTMDMSKTSTGKRVKLGDFTPSTSNIVSQGSKKLPMPHRPNNASGKVTGNLMKTAVRKKPGSVMK